MLLQHMKYQSDLNDLKGAGAAAKGNMPARHVPARPGGPGSLKGSRIK